MIFRRSFINRDYPFNIVLFGVILLILISITIAFASTQSLQFFLGINLFFCSIPLIGLTVFKLKSHHVIRILLIGLPLHTFVMMLLFGRFNFPEIIVPLLSSWKELLTIFTAILVFIRSYTTLKRIRITYTDCFVVLFTVWIILRTLWSYLSLQSLPLVLEIYGLRAYLVPIALYTIGRLAPLNRKYFNYLFFGLVVIGGITGFIAVVERLLPDSIFINLLRNVGYFKYYTEIVSAPAMYGPENTSASMWVPFGGQFIRRAGSIYMVSKPYAFTYLLIIPIGYVLLWTKSTILSKRWLQFALVLCWMGLLLSLTRAAIAVCLCEVMSLCIYFKRWKFALSFVILAVISVIILISISSVRDYAMSILTANDSSTRQHLNGWIFGIYSSFGNLLAGHGVGTASQEILRFNNLINPLNMYPPESIYVQTLEELGLIGTILYVNIFVSVLLRSRRLAKIREITVVQLNYSVCSITWGIILVSFFSIIWQASFVITFFYWLIIGQLNSIRLSQQPMN